MLYAFLKAFVYAAASLQPLERVDYPRNHARVIWCDGCSDGQTDNLVGQAFGNWQGAMLQMLVAGL